jgi:hypothetical protein
VNRARLPIRWLVPVMLIAALGATDSAIAQGPSLDPFTEQAVVLAPPPLPDGSAAENVFSDWGILLSSTSGGTPVKETRTVWAWHEGPWIDAPVILNSGDGDNPGSMVIRFDSPVYRIFLQMGSERGGDGTATFFDADGAVVDRQTRSLQHQYNLLTPAFFLEIEEGPAISRIQVEYEDPDDPEALFTIHADFVEPRAFDQCVAHLAHGVLREGEGTLQTSLSLTNQAIWNVFLVPHPYASVSLEFRGQDGNPLPLDVDEIPGSRFELELDALESQFFYSSGVDGELVRGYACASSDYPLELAAVYRIVSPDGLPVTEAGIQGTAPGYRFLGAVQKDPDRETNTAMAVANPSDRVATVAVTFFKGLNTTLEAEVVLAAGEQQAWFVEEVLPELNGRRIEGSVQFVSDVEIVATSLRTIRGIVSASLPLRRMRDF